MCGFAGEFVWSGSGRADLSVAEAMAARLAHRGPDETDAYRSPDGRFAVGFRRLAVIDPADSHQPMASGDGSAVVAFNGEIYNFRTLREELAEAGVTLRTAGDTEVLPELYTRRGLEMVAALEGMFAFCIWDAPASKVLLARDRVGQKPLFYAVLADRIVFGSELKAVLAHPMVVAEIDPAAVGQYLLTGYIPAPRTIYRGICKLAPAHTLAASPAGVGEPRRYWSLPERTREITPREAAHKVAQTVGRAVEKRMIADVPLGALLSGGVDSSVVTALMCRAAGEAGGVKTFTAGFAEAAFDERPFAAEVAAYLGTDHAELLVGPGDYDLPALIDRLAAHYDEPFADSSAVPTYLICRAAAEHVTVALTGDGGDEALGGYDRYRAMRLAETMGPGSYAAVKLAAAGAEIFAPHDERNRLRRLVRFAAGLDDVPARQYLRYRRLFSPAELSALLERDFAASADTESATNWFVALYEQGDYADEVAYAQRHDILTYLPDDLLVKADMASMASSLELRSPMLDHEVIALGLSLPASCKIRRRRGKAVVADAFGAMLPPAVFRRPKTGFGAPIDRWLREDLLAPMRETLLEGPLVERDWMSRPVLSRMIDDHLNHAADHRHRLWALLWLGRWLAVQG